jgi:PAS domain S-box-containing protein
MAWLVGGVAYSVAYIAVGWSLRGNVHALLWFRGIALLIAPLAGVVAIAFHRRRWSGCQWLFWGTIALGLTMSGLGLIGWTVDELLLAHETSWVGWYSVFALFGGIAPLWALLAQPHRGVRESATGSTAVDIAGIGVLTGFLYSHFVVGPGLVPLSAQRPSISLLLLCEFQQLVVLAGMTAAAAVARRNPWGPTYRRLALGFLVQFAVLSVSGVGIYQGLYRSGFVYDLVWILPFSFFPWAASLAPQSTPELAGIEDEQDTPSRPWVVFGALALTPVLDYGLRQVLPLGPLEAFRDLFTAITVFSVLPLLMARLAVERGEVRLADGHRRLLATAVEQADDQITILAADGRIEHANQSFCRMVGRSPRELVGTPASDLLAAQSRSQMAVVLEEAQTAGVWRGTLVRERPGGATALVASAVVGLSDGDGAVRHLVSVERDVTGETRLREQLIHSERLAAVGQLVAGVAHELNNPLQTVVGFSELLLAAEPRDQTRADLELVHAEAFRAAKIVRNLLSFARRSPDRRETMQINDLVSGTLALKEYELRASGVQVETQYAGGLPSVHVNREEIQQVLLNLILNAEQALRAGGGTGRLEVRTVAAGDGIAVEIQDDGPGVPQALAGQIFEPFFSTKEVGQGTGLGLSIGLGIAESHGGTLVLVPTDRGACFRLSLPGADRAAAAAPADVRGWMNMTGRRALVVDNEPEASEVLQRLLTVRGFAVDAAADDHEAADRLTRQRYDAILCDLGSLGRRGIALYDTVRRRQPHLLEAFIFVTGASLDPAWGRLVETARRPQVSRPVTAERLDAALAQCFAPPRQTEAAAAKV